MKRIILSTATSTVAVLFFMLGQGQLASGDSPPVVAPPPVVLAPIWGGCYTQTCVRRVHHKDHLRAVARRKARLAAVVRRRQSMPTAVASWYQDAGGTASGRRYPMNFAALIYGSQWGLRVAFCAVRCAVGQLGDHGPYVGGRTFDLGPNLKAALGCGDICVVHYKVCYGSKGDC